MTVTVGSMCRNIGISLEAQCVCVSGMGEAGKEVKKINEDRITSP